MSDSRPLSSIPESRDLNDAAYMEELIIKNEELLLEVNRLQHIIKDKGLDQVHALREENKTLRHQLELLEVEHNSRDGIHSALKDLSEQFRTTYNSSSECKTLEQQNMALKQELLRVTMSEEEARRAQQEAERRGVGLNEEITKLRTALQELTSQLEIMEKEKKEAEALHKEAVKSLQESLAHTHELQEQHAALNEKISAATLEATEQSRLKREKHSLLEQELAGLREAHMQSEEQCQVMEDQKAALRNQLRVAQEALLTREKEFSIELSKQREELEEMRRKEVEELKRGMQEKEIRLQHHIEKYLSINQQMEIIKAENHAIMERYGMKPEDVAELQKRVNELREERSRKDELQQRYQAMLSSSTSINSEIKDLFVSMLDYQERQEEEMLTMLRIQQIQQEEEKKVYEYNIRKLREENKTLGCKIKILIEEHANANRTAPTTTTTSTTSTTEPVTTNETSWNLPQGGNSLLPPYTRETARPNPPAWVPNTGSNSEGRSGSSNNNTMNDMMWGQSALPPMNSGAPAAWYHDPRNPSGGAQQSRGCVPCPRCTLNNKPGATVCEVCGSPI
ncbi:uncharacterized protein TM35_000014120 [Trypanosoma theileri]|uniref:Uncharacterized protein n=1 Tax=Trypanosoma theileri TaxID=67003 RepID=A0A1X0P9M9_9TRYP|nr:uncharacterized protein TM35_000014120 [Trypanosoma theileri]ORC93535.1 hypothetical protein TM35_000014120 [Trypanosoma theileri]